MSHNHFAFLFSFMNPTKSLPEERKALMKEHKLRSARTVREKYFKYRVFLHCPLVYDA